MPELGVAEDYHGPGTHFESENGSEFFAEFGDVLEEGFSGTGELEEVSDDWPSGRSGREVEGFGFLSEEED